MTSPRAHSRLGMTRGRADETTVDSVGNTLRLSTDIRQGVTSLWEAGDDGGKRIGPLTCGDARRSTIHSPYYWLCTSIQERERETLP